MENVVEKLEIIESGLKILITKHKDLQIEYTILKEERDLLQEEINKIKIENINKISENNKKAGSSVVIQEDNPVEQAEKLEDKTKSVEEIKQMKMELDSYISEIDQCIEIIQSK